MPRASYRKTSSRFRDHVLRYQGSGSSSARPHDSYTLAVTERYWDRDAARCSVNFGTCDSPSAARAGYARTANQDTRQPDLDRGLTVAFERAAKFRNPVRIY